MIYAPIKRYEPRLLSNDCERQRPGIKSETLCWWTKWPKPDFVFGKRSNYFFKKKNLSVLVYFSLNQIFFEILFIRLDHCCFPLTISYQPWIPVVVCVWMYDFFLSLLLLLLLLLPFISFFFFLDFHWRLIFQQITSNECLPLPPMQLLSLLTDFFCYHYVISCTTCALLVFQQNSVWIVSVWLLSVFLLL